MSTHFDQTEQLQPDVLARLAEQAKRTGDTVNGFLTRILDEREAAGRQGDRPFYETATPEELANAFIEWANSHDPHTPIILDDSREAIYEDDGR